MDKLVYSFDVFDTCLIRTCGFPSAVFHLTGRALLDILPPQSVTWTVEEFVNERVRAENVVINMASREEISLHDIWIQLCKALGLDFNDDLVALELENERKVLSPNPEVLSKINSIRDRGALVLFISDMYLPYEFVLEELTRHGFFHSEDRLYLSSHIGLRKNSGNLYKHILETESLSPRQLHHIGDNRKSDYLVPLQLGIHAKHYKGAEFNDLEKRLLINANNDLLTLMPLISAMREYRLSTKFSGLSELVGNFMGPFMVLFAHWILQNAQKNNIKHLYFFSRDCQALNKVASKLSENNFDIGCHYLLVSRQALFLPSAEKCNSESMPWLIRNCEISSLGSLLAKLELNSHEWLDCFQSLHRGLGASYIIENSEDQEKFWSILQEPDIQALILDKIEQRRASALKYFRSLGILDQDKVGVVDLGWHGTCQAALKKIINLSEAKTTLYGYLLGIVCESLPKSQTGQITALFRQKTSDDPSNFISQPVFKHINKIEHVIGLANHFSLHHYENGLPVFQFPADSFNENLKKNVDLIHSELERFASIFNAKREENYYLDDELVRQASAILLNEFWTNPSAQSMSLFTNVTASTDQNNLNQVPLISPFTLKQALRQFLPKRFFGVQPIPGGGVIYWPEASYQVSTIGVKFLLNIRKLISRISLVKYL